MHSNRELNPSHIPELEVFHKALEGREVGAQDAISAIMQENAVWFQNLGDKFNIEPSLVLFIFSTPLRPFFEELARKVEKDLIETWWEPFCPVCGRSSHIARMRKGKRYMSCAYCGTQYLVDLFQCIHCGNNDPTSLAFIGFRGHSEYELNYCEKCEQYLNVIWEDRIERKIPQGLESILTSELDTLDKGQELKLKHE
jgi:FdhE protein